jgi:hypothetical protein
MILFIEIKISKLINYSANMCGTCQGSTIHSKDWGRGFTSYKFKSPDQAHYLGLGTINCTLLMLFHNWKLGLV